MNIICIEWTFYILLSGETTYQLISTIAIYQLIYIYIYI
jgi:hypothetical protein